MAVRIGIDLVQTHMIEAAIRSHGHRYLQRVYTAEELDDCGSDAQLLAACFAAKEATIKALKPGEDAIAWSSISVRSGPGGAALTLTRQAAALAQRLRLGELVLSITHQGTMAAAIVIAVQLP